MIERLPIDVLRLDLDQKIRGSAHMRFVAHSWIKNARDEQPWCAVDKKVYDQQHHDLVHRVALRGDVLFAVVPADHTHYLGWLVYSADCVHFAYVKAAYRREGIFKRMVAASHDEKLTQHSQRASGWLGKKLKNYDWSYNPYLLGGHTL